MRATTSIYDKLQLLPGYLCGDFRFEAPRFPLFHIERKKGHLDPCSAVPALLNIEASESVNFAKRIDLVDHGRLDSGEDGTLQYR